MSWGPCQGSFLISQLLSGHQLQEPSQRRVGVCHQVAMTPNLVGMYLYHKKSWVLIVPHCQAKWISYAITATAFNIYRCLIRSLKPVFWHQQKRSKLYMNKVRWLNVIEICDEYYKCQKTSLDLTSIMPCLDLLKFIYV